MLEKLRNTKQCQAMISNAEKNDEFCLNYQMIYSGVRLSFYSYYISPIEIGLLLAMHRGSDPQEKILGVNFQNSFFSFPIQVFMIYKG